MSQSGKYTPLTINALGSLIQDTGLTTNPNAVSFMGTSTGLSNYTPGTITNDTVLYRLSSSIKLAYDLVASITISGTYYTNLCNIGSTSIPALGLSKPSTYSGTYSGELTSYGFLRLIALQAYNEFHINNGSYSDFLQTFSTCNSFKLRSNKVIESMNAATTYLDGIYSNMNDLITGDIAGVSLSTFYWGQDLIASGRAIDLSMISTFGTPSDLLKTLYKNRALTTAANLALLAAGLSSTDISDIINGAEVSVDRQKNLYGAFSIIIGTDLSDVLIALNCQTQKLTSLADLLDPKKLFPNSYKTLTVPEYNTTVGPTNSKTYHPIYVGDDTNSQVLATYGGRLIDILPETVACACDAFGTSMLQIKNIKSANIEKFSQVVTHLEMVSDLSVNGTSLPTNQDVVTTSLPLIAKGTGKFGVYTMCDFFGAMTGLTYDWKELQGKILALQTDTLVTIYQDIYDVLDSATPTVGLQDLIDDANTEITNIYNNNTAAATTLNDLYDLFGTHLVKEQAARELALPNLDLLTTAISDIYSFIENLNQYATQTDQYDSCPVIESISDLTGIGGSSLVASMREIRNAIKLGLAGIEQDSDIQTEKLNLPKLTGKIPTVTTDGVTVLMVNEGPLVGISAITGAATTLGSLGGSPETTLVPTNLDIFNIQDTVLSSVMTPAQAVEQVILCNCDCWDNLPP